jgi:phosphorylated CTD-interacting factor 1
LEEAEARIWDPEAGPHALASSSGLPTADAFEDRSLAREARRGEALRRLRLSFVEAMRAFELHTPCVGAFERWHLAWLLEARTAAGRSEQQDTLLPATPTCAPPRWEADVELQDELTRAGASAEAAAAAVSSLRGAAASAAAALAREKTAGGGGELEAVAIGPNSGGGPKSAGLWTVSWPGAGGGSTSLKLAPAHLEKLRSFHSKASEPGRFGLDLARLLLRYKSLGGSGFQAALGGAAFAALRKAFGVGAELFASPLNARTAPFCSGFADVDGAFGSAGSFLGATLAEGCYEANPPFCPPLIGAMARKMGAALDEAERHGRALLFVVVVGASSALRRHAAWAELERLAAGPHGRAHWSIALQHHGYTEGHAHICPGGPREASRMSSCATSVFVLASCAAAKEWPVTPQKEAALRAAMRATVPARLKRATKANKRAHAIKNLKKKGAR